MRRIVSRDTARHSQRSRNPFHAGSEFRGYLVHEFATACQVARPPCTDRTGTPQPAGAFTSRLSGRSPFPLLDITTTAIGPLYPSERHRLVWRRLFLKHATLSLAFKVDRCGLRFLAVS